MSHASAAPASAAADDAPGASRLKKLKFEARIGMGARGQVWSALTPSGRRVAVKVLLRDDEDTGIEVAALGRVLPHGNIAALLVRAPRRAAPRARARSPLTRRLPSSAAGPR